MWCCSMQSFFLLSLLPFSLFCLISGLGLSLSFPPKVLRLRPSLHRRGQAAFLAKSSTFDKRRASMAFSPGIVA